MEWSIPPPTKDEAVREAGRSVESRLAGPAQPCRDGSFRPRHEGGAVNPVEAASEVDHGFGEQAAQQANLLLVPSSTGSERLPERLVLDWAPTDTHTQPQPTTGQQIDVGRLPCDQRGLPLVEG